MLEKTTRYNLLYDYYQNLLTDKQRQYMEMYYHDDFSLSEIAAHYQVSRQAVFENIKRAEQLLEEYESHLQLLSKQQQREELFTQLWEQIDLLESSSDLEILREIVTALHNVE